MKLLQPLQDLPSEFPMEMFNEEHAKKIHSQSLARLNERGGLTAKEMLCNILKCKWSQVQHMDDNYVCQKLKYYLSLCRSQP